MFRGVRQCGFIPVLQSFGSSPLEIWNSKVRNGSIRRVTDEQVRALALELAGTNVSTCFIYCPKEPRASLGIHMPYLVLVIKNMKKYFTFEVTILDDKNVHRRFRMSNFEKMNRVHHFCTSMPLCLNPGWNEIYFDLNDFTRKAYKSSYVETTRIEIHANCRIRVIYFCDRIYEDKDIPQKFKMYLPADHICRKKGEEGIPDKKEESLTDYESQLYEAEEEEEEEVYVEESVEEAVVAKEEETKPEGIIDDGIVSIQGEGEYEYGGMDDADVGEGERPKEPGAENPETFAE